MAPQPIQISSEHSSSLEIIIKAFLQNITTIGIIVSIACVGFVFYIILKRETYKEKDPFRVRFEEIKKELKKYMPKFRKDKIQLFSGLSFFLISLLTILVVFMNWLFGFLGIFITLGIIGAIYFLLNKFGAFYDKKSVILMNTKNNTSKKLGKLLAIRSSPEGWLEILFQRGAMSGKGEEVLRININKKGQLLAEKKDNKTGRTDLIFKEIELPHNQIMKTDLALFIYGLDVFEFKYFTYVSCTDKDGNVVDMRRLIVSREMMHIMPSDMVAMAKELAKATAMSASGSALVQVSKKLGAESVDVPATEE